MNQEARESSKAEECDAICELRGVSPATAPLSLQLKAIDEEYHHLIGSGQGVRADHVMGLYAWKSKQAKQVWLLHLSFSKYGRTLIEDYNGLVNLSEISQKRRELG